MPRNRAWGDVNFNVTIADSAQLSPIDLLVDLAASDTITVARIIGRIKILPNAANQVADSIQRVDMGIGVTAVEAFNTAGVPNPAASDEYPPRGWIWIDTAAMWLSGTVSGFMKWEMPEVHFDIRAQRRIDKGRLFFTAGNNNSTGSNQTIRLVGRIRALCLT